MNEALATAAAVIGGVLLAVAILWLLPDDKPAVQRAGFVLVATPTPEDLPFATIAVPVRSCQPDDAIPVARTLFPDNHPNRRRLSGPDWRIICLPVESELVGPGLYR